MKVELTPAMTEWLAHGRRGCSSNTIFQHLTGIKANSGRIDYPLDPDDLARCRRLLSQCPEFVESFQRMAECSREWAALVPEWDALCSMMDVEAPNWESHSASAPKTYARMKQLLDPVRAKRRGVFTVELQPSRCVSNEAVK